MVDGVTSNNRDGGQEPRRRGYTGTSRDPDRTSQAILQAATLEFAEKGIGGARVDAVAERAGVNKRMIYHYFGDKQGLYLAVLEEAYLQIRTAEADLDLEKVEPEDGIRRLTAFTWRYFIEHPEFLSLLATENLHKAENLRGSAKVLSLHSPFIERLRDVLTKGAAQGHFREGLDPVDVYISIASLAAFYLSNRYTLSTIFSRDLAAPERLAAWREHITHVVLASIRQPA
jgi:AcrR family transcriptional regulator